MTETEGTPRPWWKRAAMSAVRILLGVFIGLTLFLLFFQNRYIYRPESEIIMTPRQVGLTYEDVTFETADHVKLSGWWVKAAQPRGTVLFCHSNYGNVSYFLDALTMMNHLGLDVFIFDYRGFGRSEGRPDEEGTYADTEAARQWLIDHRAVDDAHLLIWGRSLGAAMATRLARDHRPRALIIESGFTSFPDMAAHFYPYLPVRWIARFDYPVIDYVKDVRCPVLVVASRDDEIIPFEQGQRIFAAAPEPKVMLEISGTHNDAYVTSGEVYQKGLEDFLTRYYFGGAAGEDK